MSWGSSGLELSYRMAGSLSLGNLSEMLTLRPPSRSTGLETLWDQLLPSWFNKPSEPQEGTKKSLGQETHKGHIRGT